MLPQFISKFLNPIWTQADTHQGLIHANYCYPSTVEGTHKKWILGFAFYFSFTVYSICFFFHGIFFNFYSASWPTLAKIVSYHPNLPSIMRIAKFMCTFGSGEIIFFRLYFMFLRWRRKEKFNKLLKFDLHSTSKVRGLIFKSTEFICMNTSFMTISFAFFFFTGGIESTDTIGKYITYINVPIVAYGVRYIASDLFLLYSYVILIAHSVIKISSRIPVINNQTSSWRMESGFELSTFVDDESISSFLNQYRSTVGEISKFNSFIATLVVTGKLLVIPLMALTWSLLFESPESLFLVTFKWFFVSFASFYALRVYFLSAYLSIVHTKSKGLYSTTNSILARGKVARVKHRRKLFFITQCLSGQYNYMAYRDTWDGIVEQKDVLRSIFTTLEFLLLMLGFTFKNRL